MQQEELRNKEIKVSTTKSTIRSQPLRAREQKELKTNEVITSVLEAEKTVLQRMQVIDITFEE